MDRQVCSIGQERTEEKINKGLSGKLVCFRHWEVQAGLPVFFSKETWLNIEKESRLSQKKGVTTE